MKTTDEKQHTCCGRIVPRDTWGSFHTYSCGKPAPLEHEGKWYCKMHHPPTAGARKAAKPHCALCSTTTREGQKYCRVHESVSVPRDEYERLLALERRHADS